MVRIVVTPRLIVNPTGPSLGGDRRMQGAWFPSRWSAGISAAGAAFAAAGLGWALIRISKCWGATASERVRELPGDELLPLGRSTTYAITIAVPPQEVWPWLVQIGRGRDRESTRADVINKERRKRTVVRAA
jgi:hypothetical protein